MFKNVSHVNTHISVGVVVGPAISIVVSVWWTIQVTWRGAVRRGAIRAVWVVGPVGFLLDVEGFWLEIRKSIFFPITYIVSGDVGWSFVRTVVAASCLYVERMTNILMSQRIRITEPFHKCYGQNLPNFTMIKWENSFKILNLNFPQFQYFLVVGAWDK